MRDKIQRSKVIICDKQGDTSPTVQLDNYAYVC